MDYLRCLLCCKPIFMAKHFAYVFNKELYAVIVLSKNIMLCWFLFSKEKSLEETNFECFSGLHIWRNLHSTYVPAQYLHCTSAV